MLAALPGIGPYRLVSLIWDAIHSEEGYETDDRYNLREKSDLLDNDLVCRSALALAPRFTASPLIFTADDPQEFRNRRSGRLERPNAMRQVLSI